MADNPQNNEVFPLLVKGFFVGIANIIPGVSGGTMALVLGIYERLIAAIGKINVSSVKTILLGLTFQKERIRHAVIEAKNADVLFLGLIGVGAVVAIGATSKLMRYLLVEWHDPTYGFFMGLILVSIITPVKMLRGFRFPELVALVLAAIMTVGLTFAVSSDEKLSNAQTKYEMKQSKLSAQAAEPPHSQSLPRFDHSPMRLAFMFFCGAIAISAMILPGVSGSFIMLLLGVYFEILEAVSSFDVLTLAAVAAGCGVGLLSFTRLLTYVFREYHDITISFLIGLMVGSLVGIWPFKTFAFVGEKRIDLDYIWPALEPNTFMTVLSFAVGCLLVLAFLAYEKNGKSST